jgi:hypothetical protein
VGTNRLMALNDANKARAKLINEQVMAAKASAKRSSAASKADGSGGGSAASAKKRRVEGARAGGGEEDIVPTAVPGFELVFSFVLKKVLVEDWELVTQR